MANNPLLGQLLYERATSIAAVLYTEEEAHASFNTAEARLNMGDATGVLWVLFLPGLLASIYLGCKASLNCGLILLLTTGAIAGLVRFLFGETKKNAPDSSPRSRASSLRPRSTSATSLTAAFAALALCEDLESPSALKCVSRVMQHLSGDREGQAVQLVQMGAAQFLSSALARLPDHCDRAFLPVTSLLVEIMNQPAALEALRGDDAALSELTQNYLCFSRRLAQAKLVSYSSVDAKSCHIASRYQMVIGLALLAGEPTSTSASARREAVEILMELCSRNNVLLQSSKLVRSVLCAVGILCNGRSELLSHLCRHGAVAAIQRILEAHPQHRGVAHDACAVLYLLVRECSEERAQCLDCGLVAPLLALQRSLPPSDPTAHTAAALLGLLGTIS